jgi:putative GTP pyrophosphokinase
MATKRKKTPNRTKAADKKRETSASQAFTPPAGIVKAKLDRDSLLQKHRLTPECVEKAGVSWEDLEWIHAIHAANQKDLVAAGNYIVERLREVPEVHSVKLRIKDADHLVAKVVRKRLEEPTRVISPDNFGLEITDLIGIRALHLFKRQWFPIHCFVSETWQLHERATAYYREGDSAEVIESFKNAGCSARQHPEGYRSVHYLLECSPTRKLYVAELQVRTLFEEGWAEIDHTVRYPNLTDDTLLTQFLAMFNRASGTADEMGSFIESLKGELERRRLSHEAAATEYEARKRSYESAIAELKKQIRELEKTLQTLSTTTAEKAKLEKELADLRAAQDQLPTAFPEFTFRTVLSDPNSAPLVYGTMALAGINTSDLGLYSTRSALGSSACPKCGSSMMRLNFSNSEPYCPTCILSNP